MPLFTSILTDIFHLQRPSANDIENRFSDIFSRSIIEVGSIGNWSDSDLLDSSNHISIITEEVANAGVFLETLYRDLDKSRVLVTVNCELT